jgi:TolA-binding protein
MDTGPATRGIRSSERRAFSRSRAHDSNRPGERRTPSPRSSAAVAASPASDPSVDFRGAIAALDVADNHQAGAAFADFLEKHPRDSRSEDAAYLRVIALVRSLRIESGVANWLGER